MKKIFVIMVFLLLTFATSAIAFTISGGINVGGLDTFVASENVKAVYGSSGDADEVQWVNDVLGTTFTVGDLTKYDTNGSWEQTIEDSNVFAHQLITSPEYYFIKTGKLASTDHRHFLFFNEFSTSFAVVDLLSSFGPGVTVENFGKFSHLGEFGDTPDKPPVIPEPSTFVLLGVGLIGVGYFAHRRKKS